MAGTLFMYPFGIEDAIAAPFRLQDLTFLGFKNKIFSDMENVTSYDQYVLSVWHFPNVCMHSTDIK